MEEVRQYIADVLEGRIPASQPVRWTLQRHLKDLEDGHLRGLRFNEARAQLVLDYFADFVVQTDGPTAGEPIELLPFQKTILALFYGWEWINTGFRRFKTAYLELARGNGKSALLSGLCSMELVAGMYGSEVYSAATDRETARVVWDTTAAMIRLHPELSSVVVEHKSNLHIPNRASKFEPLSAQERNLQGKRPTFVSIDELHAHANRGVLDAMMMALGKRDESRLVAITTAGSDRNSVCWQTREYSLKVLQGIIPDDSWFSFICCIDEGDDYRDERAWIKANPGLGKIVKIADMREAMLKASSDPASLNAFLRYRLNVWTDKVTAFYPMDKWDECQELVDVDSLLGQPCYGGLDLSTTGDIAPFVLLFPPYGDRKLWVLLPHFYLPEDAIARRVKRDRVPYDVWARQGLFTLTPGSVIDTQFILRDIKNLGAKYAIKEIGLDQAFSADIRPQIEAAGFTCVAINQGEMAMTPPLKKSLELVLRKEITFLGNPVMRWMASNLAVRTGATGLMKPDKARSSEKIDGISAFLGALARAQLAPVVDTNAWAFAPFTV
jgi:phage terminase large subunit-like protein